MTFDEIVVTSSDSAIPYNNLDKVMSELRRAGAARARGRAIRDCAVPLAGPFPYAAQRRISTTATASFLQRAYWNDMERVDDNLAMRTYIYHPLQHQLIYIDNRRRTYYTVEYVDSSPRQTTYSGQGVIKGIVYKEHRSSDGVHRGIIPPIKMFGVESSIGYTTEEQNELVHHLVLRQRSAVYISSKYATPIAASCRPTLENFFRPLPPTNTALHVDESGPPLPQGLRLYQATEAISHEGTATKRYIVSVFRIFKNTKAPKELFAVPSNYKEVAPPGS